MLYVFNENFSLDSGHDRYKLHELVDQMYDLAVFEGEDGLEVNHPEYINLDDLDFDYGDLEAYDFELMDVTAEELEEEREELHALISKRDKKGLLEFFSSLPLYFESEDKLSMEQLLNSGRLEEIVADHIVENYNGLYVEHSRSCVASNSFYIKNEDDEVLLKLSDHNTIFQEVEHDTPFINVLGKYGIAPRIK